jgi:TetR/AcrR family transcriptional regulator, cholesterol catabolism regulator
VSERLGFGGGPEEVDPDSAGAATGRRSRRRRMELVDAAARIFQEKGYEAASIQDIAEALGILKGSIYYYIDSKEDLLFAVIQEVHETALANVDLLRQVDAGPLAKIRMFIEMHLRHFTDNQVKVTVFFHDFRSLAGARRDYIVAERASYTNYLRELITVGQRDGTVCPDIDPELVTFALLGMINWTYQWYQTEGSRDPGEIGAAFADLAVAGLACSARSHRPGHRGKLGELPAGLSVGAHGRPVSAPPRKRAARRATGA